MKIEEYVDISKHCTLRVGGQFRYFAIAHSIEDLTYLCAIAHKYVKQIFILGYGSNIVFRDGVLDLFVVKMDIKGFEILSETDSHIDIKIGAGESWDGVVERAVKMNLSGIEALSVIPGTAGATPVQNVGAYGQDISQTLIEVEVFDIKAQATKTLSNADCHFSYRDSVFKHEGKENYIITAIILRLSKLAPQMPDYPGVKKYFEEKGIDDPDIHQIRQAVIDIRSVKLPDPKKIANVGSFFKNPIVHKEIGDKLKKEYPNLTVFQVNDLYTKIPAGWLIETVGLKDKSFGNISTYKNNALVLVNNGGATRVDVENTKNEIIKIVHDKFGIILEPEPEFV